MVTTNEQDHPQRPHDPPAARTSTASTPPPVQRRRISTGAKILVLGGSTVMAVLLIEVLLSATGIAKPEPRTYVGEFENRPAHNFVFDEQTGWRMRAKHAFRWKTPEFDSEYRSNAQGFRADADFAAGDPDRKIVLVGDSFTFGTGVSLEETYGGIIESALPGTRVYNLAMPGFGLDQTWLSIRHQALPLEPELVVVGIFPAMLTRSQDAYRPTEGFNKPTFILEDGRLRPRTQDDRPNAVVRLMERRSGLVNMGRTALRGLGYRFEIGEWWHLNAAILESIAADCRNDGVPILFVYLPSENWRRFPTLRAAMTESGAHFIDLMDTGVSHVPSLYYPHDGHLNAAGQSHVGRVILQWIRENMPQLASPPPRNP